MLYGAVPGSVDGPQQARPGSIHSGADRLGIELRLSNNDLAGPNERLNFESGVYHRYHPLQSAAEAVKVRELGEVEYNRRAMAEARAWIAGHPAQFLQLTLERIWLFWFYPGENIAKSAILWTRVLLGFTGLAFIWRAHPRSARVLALILMMVPLPNYLVHVALKHSYPIDWVLTMLAAVALVRMFDALYSRKASAPAGMVTS